MGPKIIIVLPRNELVWVRIKKYQILRILSDFEGTHLEN